MSTDVPTRRSDVRVGVPTGAAPPAAAPVEHDLAGLPLGRAHRPGPSGAFGPGFWSSVDMALVPAEGTVVAHLADRRLRFVPTSHGWVCSAGPHHRLTVADRTWRLEVGTGRRTACATFDGHGLLSTWSSDSGSLRLRRDARRRVIAIDHDAGRLQLDWADDRVVQVAASDGRVATYTYGSHGASTGRLVSVRRPDGVVSYRWAGEHATRRHLAAL